MNYKPVLRIMGKYGLLAEIRRKRSYRVNREKAFKADNNLAREFATAKRNEKWVADISCIRTRAVNEAAVLFKGQVQ